MDFDTLIERLPAVTRIITRIHPAWWFIALVALYLAWQYRRTVARWLARTFPAGTALLGALGRGAAQLVSVLWRGAAYLVGTVFAMLAFAVGLLFRPVLLALGWIAVLLMHLSAWMIGAAEMAGDGMAAAVAGTGRAARALWIAFASSAFAAALHALGRAIVNVPPRLVWLVCQALKAAWRLLRSIWHRLEMLARGLAHFVSANVPPPLRSLRSLAVLPFRLAGRVLARLAAGLARLIAFMISAVAGAGNRAVRTIRPVTARMLTWLHALATLASRIVLLPMRFAWYAMALLARALTRLAVLIMGAAASAAFRMAGASRRVSGRALSWLRTIGSEALAVTALPFRTAARILTLLNAWLGGLDAWLIYGAERTGARAGSFARGVSARAVVALRSVTVRVRRAGLALWAAVAKSAASGALNAVWRAVSGVVTRSLTLGSRALLLVLEALRLAVRGIAFVVSGFARLAMIAGGAAHRALVRAGSVVGTAFRMIVLPLVSALRRAFARTAAAIHSVAALGARSARVAWSAFVSSKVVAAIKAMVRVISGVLAQGVKLALRGAGLLLSAAVTGLMFAAYTGLNVIGLVAAVVLMPFRALPAWHARLGARTRFAMNGLLAGGALVALWYVVLPPWPTLRIAAGSGHASFEPILQKWAAANKVNLEISYKGSLDMMLMLKNGDFPYDAIWEADSLWTSLSGNHDIKDTRSIMCSPVVFGVKRSIAEQLGWVGKTNVHMQDVLAALEEKKLRTLMTSATQSNSGASAYFGFLYAFAGQPDLLSAEHLADPGVQAQTKRVLATMARTSESSGFLRDLLAANYDSYDAMFNYESHIIEANQKLAKLGQEPLYVVYLQEGLGSADFPFSFVAKGNADKEPLFNSLQQYLLSGEAQAAIAAKGRRVGPLCNQMDPTPSDWGVDAGRTINALRYPAAAVIWDALHLYQTRLRKPSDTVFALDFSASMEGDGKQQLLRAMRTVLDQVEAQRFLLEASSDDVNTVLLFNHTVMNANDVAGWTVSGNQPGSLEHLLGQIAVTRPAGRTDIYQPAVRALEEMHGRGVGARLPAIILMTDGESNTGSPDDIEQARERTGLRDVPIYGVTFGDASVAQLEAIAKLTRGRVYDGSKDLISAIKSAKANN